MTPSTIEFAKTELHQIATHAYNLAMGLQNAAPPDAPVGSSVQYLREVSIELEAVYQEVTALTTRTEK